MKEQEAGQKEIQEQPVVVLRISLETFRNSETGLMGYHLLALVLLYFTNMASIGMIANGSHSD